MTSQVGGFQNPGVWSHLFFNWAEKGIFNQFGISLYLRTVVTSWSYCSRGKWPIDYQNDQSSLFRGSYRHISKIFHLEYTRYVRVLRIGSHIGSALRNVSTFCGSFLSLLYASVSMRFRSKERGTRVKHRAKKAHVKEQGRGPRTVKWVFMAFFPVFSKFHSLK